MRNLRRAVRALTLTVAILAAQTARTRHQEPESSPLAAQGTLNLILANKNGFVIVADSRMSTMNGTLPCNGHLQSYCDNSQKLFRTGKNSAMAISGFAVGKWNTPLDLTVASVLRKRFGPEAASKDQDTFRQSMGWTQIQLSQPLREVAALYDPSKTSSQDLSLRAIFGGFGIDGAPVLGELRFTGAWQSMGPTNVLVPEYQVASGQAAVTKFSPLTSGITCVADAVLVGIYKTEDPIILTYYQRKKNNQLDEMPLKDMRDLAVVILRETKKFTELVGGEDEIGVFPVKGEVEFTLPKSLPSESSQTARIMIFENYHCGNSDPKKWPCESNHATSGVSFIFDSEHPIDERFKKMFLANQFNNQVSVLLDNNLFVANSFDGATLKWQGADFFALRNTFSNCVLELPEGAEEPPNPDLHGKCRLERKRTIQIPRNTVGLPAPILQGGFDLRP